MSGCGGYGCCGVSDCCGGCCCCCGGSGGSGVEISEAIVGGNGGIVGKGDERYLWKVRG